MTPIALSLLLSAPPPASPPTSEEYARLEGREVVVRTWKSKRGFPRGVARILIEASPERVFRIIDNCNRYKYNMKLVTHSKQIKRKGPVVVCEVVVDLPFPFGDLRSVTKGFHTVGPPMWGRRWSLVSGDYRVNEGAWELTRFKGDPGRTLATYRTHIEPRMNLPDFIVAGSQKRSLPMMLTGLRDLVVRNLRP